MIELLILLVAIPLGAILAGLTRDEKEIYLEKRYFPSLIPILFILMKKAKVAFFILFIYVVYLSLFPQIIDLKYFSLNSLYFTLFFAGYIFVVIEKKFKKIYNFDNVFISSIACILIYFELFFFKDSYGIFQFMILGIVFTFIMLGNSIFGILNRNFSKFLGEISYSIYLIHGLVLYIVFKVITENLPEIYYMPFVLLLVIIVATLTFKYIEFPANKYSKFLANKLLEEIK